MPASGPWVKSIDLAAKYAQKDCWQTGKFVCQMENKTKPRKNALQVWNAIREKPTLSLYSYLLSYYPHIKFL